MLPFLLMSSQRGCHKAKNFARILTARGIHFPYRGGVNFECFVFEEEKINNPLGYFYPVFCHGIITLMSLKLSLDHKKAGANPQPVGSTAGTSTDKESQGCCQGLS